MGNNTEHSMGTSIIACKFEGGVVLGADSRTSTGVYIANRVSSKIDHVCEKVFCCRSGSAADTQAVSDIVKNAIDQHTVTTGEAVQVPVVANIFKELCYRNKNMLSAGI